jgi:hypothetical protein
MMVFFVNDELVAHVFKANRYHVGIFIQKFQNCLFVF